MMPWRYLERPHAIGAWVCTALDKPQPAPPGPGLVEEQPHDDGRIAMTDPLIGLLSMQVLLERISFLLRSPAAAAAASPLLLILQAYARAGADTARAVWQCPGMLEALQGLLQRAATLSADVMTVVRLLSSSSAQMLKAVASSGLLAHAQRALAVATAGRAHGVEEQLQHLSMQVEALHIWRICAEHNMTLMHLDDAFFSICRLFDWPPSASSPASRQGRGESRGHVTPEGGPVTVPHASSAQLSKAEQLLQKVRVRGSCQAFLLLGSLVRHANRDPERAMLSPGSATALVNAALEWLQPQLIHALTSSLLDPTPNPRPDSNPNNRRQGSAAAPGPFCSVLAAVLQFLEAHVQARQVAADIHAVKEALFTCELISAPLQTATSSLPQPLQDLMAVFHTQSPPKQAAQSPPNHDQSTVQQQHADQAQNLETQTALESSQVQASLVNVRLSAHDSRGAELQSCASELLYAVGSLSATLSRHQAIEDACVGGVNKAIIQALSDQALSTGAVPVGPSEIQPWTATFMQQRLPQLRLLQYALENAPVSHMTANESQHVLQTALALPAVLPPGAEATALRALSTAFQTALLGPALLRACRALHSFQAGNSSLAMAAAGLTFKQIQSMRSMHSRQAASPDVDRSSAAYATSTSNLVATHETRQHLVSSQQVDPSSDTNHASSSSAGSIRADQDDEEVGEEEEEAQLNPASQLYPLEPLPDQATCCQRLLQGFSAAWLGLVPAAPASTSAGHAALGPLQEGDALLQPVGSRLPLPLGYPLMEITPPQAAATPDPHPPSSNPGPALQPIPEEDEDEGQCKPAAPAVEADTKLDESAALSVGCALLMQLALEEGSPPRLYGSASTGSKIKSTMDMVFSPEAAANVGAAEELWYHSLVRWSLAALLHRWYAEQPDLSGLLPDDAQRWTEHFAALSYGDPLFSLALSPLLSTQSPVPVQARSALCIPCLTRCDCLA
ncbi:hypothetical protein ABBQ38_015223 [Trebouxia sp. C0009 RCD-2024]